MDVLESAYGGRMPKAAKMSKIAKSMHGAGWEQFADAFRHGPDHFFAAAKNEFVNPNSDLRTQILPVASAVLAATGNEAAALGLDAANQIGRGIYGIRGEVKQTREVTGRLIHKRRPLAENDVRRRRSALVGQVMKAEGMSLGQASKLVKERGLKY